MKVLVTGFSGRFGPYVVRELKNAGHEPVLMGRKKPEGELAGLEWRQGTITNYADCAAAAGGGVEAVMHLAAQPWPTDHPRTQDRRRQAGLPVEHMMGVNVMGTYNLLHSAKEAGIRLFVMTGSNCVLGHTMRISGREFPCVRLPVQESHPADIEDSYGFSKSVCEQMCELYSRVYGMKTYTLRCAGLFDAAARKAMIAEGKPAQKWDWGLWAWVAREDAARAHRMILESASTLPANGAYFCNADETFALEESMELVARFKPEAERLLERPLTGHGTFISNRKLKEATGWAPLIGRAEVLKKETEA